MKKIIRFLFPKVCNEIELDGLNKGMGAILKFQKFGIKTTHTYEDEEGNVWVVKIKLIK